MIRRILTALVFFVLMTGVSYGQSRHYANCQEVINGHTVVVYYDKELSTIRLREAICPVKPLPFWREAQTFTRKLVEKRMCQVIVYEEGESGEVVGEVILPDRRLLSAALIDAGLAWWNIPEGELRTYANKEKVARDKRLGLWSGRNPKPPWKYVNKSVKEEKPKEK